MSFLDSEDEPDDSGDNGAEEGESEDLTVVSHNLASSAIANLTYHRDTNDLFVTFVKGGRYVLPDFPEIELERWIGAPSAGEYFNAFIKGNY